MRNIIYMYIFLASVSTHSHPSLNGVWIPLGLNPILHPMVDRSVLAWRTKNMRTNNITRSDILHELKNKYTLYFKIYIFKTYPYKLHTNHLF